MCIIMEYQSQVASFPGLPSVREFGEEGFGTRLYPKSSKTSDKGHSERGQTSPKRTDLPKKDKLKVLCVHTP